MTAVVPHEDRTLYAVVDDLSAYHETLDMIEAQLALTIPDEERERLTRDRGEVQESIAAIGKELAGKTDAVAVVLRRLAHERDYIHEERDRLKAKEAAAERAEKWLRDYVVSVMQQNGMKQLKTAQNTLFLRASEAVDITDAASVPELYMNSEIKLPLWLWKELHRIAISAVGAGFCPGRLVECMEDIRVKSEPSLSTIKKAIKSGADVPGADLKLNQSLVCR